MNAWTHPIDFYLDTSMNMQNLVVTSSKGYRFKPEAKVSTDIAITSKLLFDPNFTDGEILAILLHEIGHNFESVMNQNLCTFSQLYSFLIFMTGISGQVSTLPLVGSQDVTLPFLPLSLPAMIRTVSPFLTLRFISAYLLTALPAQEK